MKKRILSVALAVVLTMIAIGSTTIAYLTDMEEATNTFTLGKVGIVLNEYDNDGKAFKNDQKLVPGSDTANAIAKNVIITVADDSEDAWVWVEILIPAALYSSKTEENENNNAIHCEQFVDNLQDYNTVSNNPNAEAAAVKFPGDHQWSALKYVCETEDGLYSVLRTTHKDAVKAKDVLSPALNQVYMDDDVYYDAEIGAYMIPADGREAGHATQFVAYDGAWELVVNAYAVQAAGIADVDAAVAAYAAQSKAGK